MTDGNMLASVETVFAPADELELSAFLDEAHKTEKALHIMGGGTRLKPSFPFETTTLTTRRLSGILTYEPGAMTLIARAGTPVEEIEAVLAIEGQALAFEPMDHRTVLNTGGVPTIGGVVATNASGPRRVQIGACRDHLLGVRFADGRGRIIKNGGRVMKNVTGLDLGKLLCGSFGTLGVLTEVAIKTLPAPESELSVGFNNVSVSEASRIFQTVLASPMEISGAAFRSGTAWLRIEGRSKQVKYRREKIFDLLPHYNIDFLYDVVSKDLWSRLRDLHHFDDPQLPLWRILVKPTDASIVASALENLGGTVSLDWGGGLIWFAGQADALEVRRACGTGQALLMRNESPFCGPRFAPEGKAVARLSKALRNQFDPAAILNRGLMDS
ncbi:MULTISPECIES: FAD-binding protein [unclassified Rhizobium]|uniref:FAD-binding protein n=1 Tax=unclassified Rhizobium TaxID=2613769 RepID=UPI0007F1464F|nr:MULTISPECIES: FAD-binding protein [unclassified Rhizobium]ANM14509.1 glycolate oxidase FAD-binding subunit GlcE 2 [Rhizobium sp. N324]ANM20895.1 glycolate oxidase FAD-binding subunit GlcE 2 [Rhizobium sp. N541]ANM27272.1 glycolate oxidase FAD-binding subunit GlcE 2 [Rhizobium sp. N941]OYC99611.1 glycolate oxidase FAD-binding subunit GlcE 2 [Rhizobium sp. N4311]